ncbi:DUF935 family protein [bacterium]|nr:DUF935 family protein [bacterium]
MRKGLTHTIADRHTAFDYYGFLEVLPNPDIILSSIGRRISAYEDMMRDAQVASCMASRKAGISQLQFDLKTEGVEDRVAETVKSAMSKFDNRYLFDIILNCVAYGYQPIEINWGYESSSGAIVPRSIVEKPAEWFAFSIENELRFLSKDHPVFGETLPPMKFVCPRHNATYKNPYGISALSACYWPVAFKKGNYKFWITFTEKYGTPWLVLKYALGTSQEDIDKLEQQGEAGIQDAVFVIPENGKVEILEAGGKSASAEIFDKLKAACNAEISKAILGQTLTTELGSGGSLAAAQVHNEVRKDIVLHDARIIEETINQIVRWIVDLNFGREVEAPKYSFSEPEEVDKVVAERDAILHGIGVNFTPEYIQKTYNLEEKDFTLSAQPEYTGIPLFRNPGIPTAADFSTAKPKDALDRAIAEAFPAEEQQKMMEKILQPVFELVENGESLQDIKAKLLDLFPDLPTDDLEDILEKAMTAAGLYGGDNA